MWRVGGSHEDAARPDHDSGQAVRPISGGVQCPSEPATVTCAVRRASQPPFMRRWLPVPQVVGGFARPGSAMAPSACHLADDDWRGSIDSARADGC